MAAIDVCQNALTKNSQYEVLPADFIAAPVGKSATLCSRWYAEARRQILRLSTWACVIKRAPLSALLSEFTGTTAIGSAVVTIVTAEALTQIDVGDEISGTGIPTGSLVISKQVAGCTLDNTATAAGAVTLTNEDWNPHMPYDYGYYLPDDFLRLVQVTDESGEPIRAELERGHLYVTQETPVLVYVPDEEDTDLWDPLLTEAITFQLAAQISYALTGSHENEIMFAKSAEYIIEEATAQTRRERRSSVQKKEYWTEDLYS
jgi:hypothetical protein